MELSNKQKRQDAFSCNPAFVLKLVVPDGGGLVFIATRYAVG